MGSLSLKGWEHSLGSGKLCWHCHEHACFICFMSYDLILPNSVWTPDPCDLLHLLLGCAAAWVFSGIPVNYPLGTRAHPGKICCYCDVLSFVVNCFQFYITDAVIQVSKGFVFLVNLDSVWGSLSLGGHYIGWFLLEVQPEVKELVSNSFTWNLRSNNGL